jgi:hypothetical protein
VREVIIGRHHQRDACIAPHRTAPHRTAPHRTAPHRIASHRIVVTAAIG